MKIIRFRGRYKYLFLSYIFAYGFYLVIRYGGLSGMQFMQDAFGYHVRASKADDRRFWGEFSLIEQKIAVQNLLKLPNLPLKSWRLTNDTKYSPNTTYAVYPSIYDINFNNIYWQILHTQVWSLYLYGAYYDCRELEFRRPMIRILAMIDKIEPERGIFCYLWFDGVFTPVTVPVLEYRYIWNKKWDRKYKKRMLYPHLISCKVPSEYGLLIPTSVSLVERLCDRPTTNLRIINNQPKSGKKEDFAVCVKGLDFLHEDVSVQLVEWLELLFILGVHKVYLYELYVHANVSKVLRYYEDSGQVDITKLSLPGEQINIPDLLHTYLKNRKDIKRRNEMIPYNDCLYRNMYRYKYIVLLDVDEVIIPKKGASWLTLIQTLQKKAMKSSIHPRDSYAIPHVYFMDSMRQKHGWAADIPKYMHMLQNVYRSKRYTKIKTYVKCFHDPERVLTLHNHFPFSCLGHKCSHFLVDKRDAHLQHYRSDCVDELEKICVREYKQHNEKDTTIWKYKDVLVPRVNKVFIKLGFLKNRNSVPVEFANSTELPNS